MSEKGEKGLTDKIADLAEEYGDRFYDDAVSYANKKRRTFINSARANVRTTIAASFVAGAMGALIVTMIFS